MKPERVHAPPSPGTAPAGLAGRRRRLGLRAALAASIGIGLVPALWPDLDIAITYRFFDPSAGFPLQRLGVVDLIYAGIPWLSRITTVALVLALLATLLRPHWRRARRAVACALLSLVLGPGLFVNVLLKEHVGRARPVQVTEFGGQRTFSPALRLSDQCERNCAFVSGHAAAGFWIATGYAVTRRRRRGWLVAGTLAGLIVGAARVVAGGHWFSDIAFSMTATLAGVAIAYLLTHRPALRWRLAIGRRRRNPSPRRSPAGPRSSATK